MKKRKTHSPELRQKVALEAIRDEMTLAELSKKYGVHPTQIGTWKRAAIENMANAFIRKGSALEPVSTVDIDKLHSKIGQLVVERDFLAPLAHARMHCRGVDASHRLTASTDQSDSHRVLGPEAERLSVPLFFNPNPDAVVSPAGSETVQAVDYLQARFDETYIHLQTKTTC